MLTDSGKSLNNEENGSQRSFTKTKKYQDDFGLLNSDLAKSGLHQFKERLKDCKNEHGCMNADMIFNALNQVQRQNDPDAYEPGIVI